MEKRPQPLKPPCGYWFTVGLDNSSWSHADNQDFEVQCDVVDDLGTLKTSDVIYVTVIGGMAKRSIAMNAATAIEADNKPLVFSFSGAYPNPFNPSTTLVYHLPELGLTRLAVIDMLGREIAVLDEGPHEAGSYRFVWHGTNGAGESVAGGLYFAHLVVFGLDGGQTQTRVKKLFLLK